MNNGRGSDPPVSSFSIHNSAFSRALRRWLLGVEPEGPPLLADPFCRYEVRKFWTLSRYLWTAGLLVAWWALLGGLLLFSGKVGTLGLGGLAVWTLGASLAARLPLSFMVAAGAALCIAPERYSGRLEQFVLTPIDPWRFCLARMAGRLYGIFVFWLAMGAVLAAGVVLAWAALDGVGGPVGLLLLLLVVVMSQLDCAGMFVADAALGMTFSAKAKNPTMALVQTFTVCFVVAPVAVGYLVLSMGGAMLGTAFSATPDNVVVVLGLLGVVLVRLFMAVLTAKYFPRDARKAMEKAFFDPESVA